MMTAGLDTLKVANESWITHGPTWLDSAAPYILGIVLLLIFGKQLRGILSQTGSLDIAGVKWRRSELTGVVAEYLALRAEIIIATVDYPFNLEADELKELKSLRDRVLGSDRLTEQLPLNARRDALAQALSLAAVDGVVSEKELWAIVDFGAAVNIEGKKLYSVFKKFKGKNPKIHYDARINEEGLVDVDG